MLATLFTHELDAVSQSEWRLLYILRTMPDAPRRLLVCGPACPTVCRTALDRLQPSVKLRDTTRTALAVFMLIHAGLHYHLRNDPLNTFNSVLSLGLIYGGAVLGLLYLVQSRISSDAT